MKEWLEEFWVPAVVCIVLGILIIFITVVSIVPTSLKGKGLLDEAGHAYLITDGGNYNIIPLSTNLTWRTHQ